jgi:uncharacterized membrane protein
MNYTHLHLLLTHFPIIGSIAGTLLLLYGIWKKNAVIREVSLVLIVIMSLIAIPVFLTGEPAEETVENIPGVIESIVEEHEEAAEIAFWVMLATGAFSLISLTVNRMKSGAGNALVMVSLALGIISAGLMARTGYLGGQIRHTEIRGGTAIDTGTGQEPQEEEDDDDDEEEKKLTTFLRFEK